MHNGTIDFISCIEILSSMYIVYTYVTEVSTKLFLGHLKKCIKILVHLSTVEIIVTERNEWNILLLYINDPKLRFIHFTILRKDISNSRTKTKGSAFKWKWTLIWTTPYPLLTCLKVSCWNVLSEKKSSKQKYAVDKTNSSKHAVDITRDITKH